MKIELRKTEKINGDVYHYVYIDDRYVEDSCRINEKEALELYERVKKQGGASKTTILKTETT